MPQRSPERDQERRARATAWVLAVVLFASYAYFYQAGGWNQNSRFALVRAVLERHSLDIDAYAAHTGDRARWQGHYYSDKAPGTSFLALGPVALARAVARLTGVDPESVAGIAWSSYVASIATAGLFTVVAALAVFWLSLRWTGALGAATFAATAYGLATPAWAYGTVFVGHGVTAGCLMLAFAAACRLGRGTPSHRGLGWLVGLACGLAVLTEFPAVIAVVVIVGLAIVTVSEVNRSELIPIGSRILFGGLIMAAILLAYNSAAFGSPLHLGYGTEDNVEGLAMQQGFFGIGHPTLHVAREVLLGSYRGLLPLAPLMAAAPIGLWMLWRTPRLGKPVIAASLVAVSYILLNVSYTYWEGGWFYGPRHLTPGLPFLSLGLAPLWRRSRSTLGVVWRGLLIAGWLWGAGVTLVTVSTTVQLPSDIQSPLRDWSWPAFREGDLSINPESYLSRAVDRSRLRHHPEAHAAWNLGEILGLSGLVSLLPLGCLWLCAPLVTGFLGRSRR